MDSRIPHIIAAHAESTPDRAALFCGERSLTYAAFAGRINQLARTLIKAGCQRGDRVGIYLEKGLDSAVTMYAIMRAGAAYVPLDPAAPSQRVAAIIADCDIQILISQSSRTRQLRSLQLSSTAVNTVIGNDEIGAAISTTISWEEVASESSEALLNRNIVETDLAYIIYTSGSTGVPKGIMHTHKSGLAFARWAAAEYSFHRDDRLSNHAPLHFDLSIMDYFSAAVAGASTVIIPEEVTRMPASYSRYIENNRISVLYTVPFALTQLLALGALPERDLSSLRWVIFGGEPMSGRHLLALMQLLPDAKFDNMYGPAEVNGISHFTVPENFEGSRAVPIGPIASTATCRIVNSDGSASESEETGELYVSTPNMMQGYWRRPDLNARVFHVESAESGADKTFYKTGDLVRRDSSGLLHFLGRKDRQIKLRGYRIELEEVEAAIDDLDGVVEAAVIAVPDSNGGVELQGFVCPEQDDLNMERARLMLKKRLPRYAIPSTFTVLTQFPRTSTGKIDRVALSRQYAEPNHDNRN